jgi:hypothetical protein
MGSVASGKQIDLPALLHFHSPANHWAFLWDEIASVRSVESLTSQHAVWSHWQKFLENPDDYLTWNYIGGNTPI